MSTDRDPDSRLALLRRLLTLVTDESAAEAIKQTIARLEVMPRPMPPNPPASRGRVAAE